MSMGINELWASSPFIMTVLFICSLILVATIIERAWCFWGPARADEDVCKEITLNLSGGNAAMAVQRAGASSTYIARALLEVSTQLQAGRTLGRQEFEDFWMLRKEEASEAMRTRLVVFGTLSFICPLLGLMGSVLGIHHSFQSIALTGMGGPSVVAQGVSEALLCTLVGVTVAIPAMIAHNALTSLLSGRMSHWDRTGQRVLPCLSMRHEGAHEKAKR